MKKMTLLLCLLLAGISISAAADEMFRLGLKYANAGKIDEALQILNEDVVENPTAERYLALGIVYLQKGDYDAAMQNLIEAVKLKPSSAPARYSLAMLYEKNKMYSEAILEWQSFLTLTPSKELKNLARKHIEKLKLLSK